MLRNMIPSASVCRKFALSSIASASSMGWLRTDAGAGRCGLLEKGTEQLAHVGCSRRALAIPRRTKGVWLEIGSNNGKKYCGIMMPIITTRLLNAGKKGFTTL